MPELSTDCPRMQARRGDLVRTVRVPLSIESADVWLFCPNFNKGRVLLYSNGLNDDELSVKYNAVDTAKEVLPPRSHPISSVFAFYRTYEHLVH